MSELMQSLKPFNKLAILKAIENFAEVKKLVDDLGKSVHDMREANEQKMAELAKNNGVAELKEAQARLDAQVQHLFAASRPISM